MSAPLLTAIVPLRVTEGLYEGTQRLSRILGTIPPGDFAVLVVDYGSPPPGAAAIADLCAHHQHASVVRVDCELEVFSIGRARDIGVQHATTPVIVFNDVDFIAPPSMYARIAQEARVRGMDRNAYPFFCVPVVFLSPQGTEHYHALAGADDGRFAHAFHSAVMEGRQAMYDFVTYGSPAMVVNRLHYLAIGGHDRRFLGHGAEDFDVLHRLARYHPRGPRPRNYLTDSKTNAITTYEGFRAYFALYGIDVFQRGIFLVHLWHPTRLMDGYTRSARNFAVLRSAMDAFDTFRTQPVALADLASTTRTLLLVDPTSTVAGALRHAMPLMGRVTALAESTVTDAAAVIDFVRREAITHVGLLNPYGNDKRLAIYRELRRKGVAHWTFDRGALPDSWFFDPGGFNADSRTYEREAWDRPLADGQRATVMDYMRQLRASDATLERNGARLTGGHWRQALGLGARRVLFVPLQRPGDTVTRHFAGAAGSCATFLDWVQAAARQLDPMHWAVVVKKHPLEAERPQIEGAVLVPDDAHIHDLLELADCVLTMNSGTGVLAAAFGKPVIACSECFYGDSRFVWQAGGPDDILALLQGELRPDPQAVERFLYHLIARVYSFGATAYQERHARYGASTTSIVRDIRFSAIRGLTREPVLLGTPQEADIPLDAPLFHSFGGKAAMTAALANGINGAHTDLTPDEAIRRNPAYQVFKLVAYPFQTPSVRRKLDERPEAFFRDARSPYSKFVGRLVLR